MSIRILQYASLLTLAFTISVNAKAQSPGGVTSDNTLWLRADIGTTLNLPANTVNMWNEQSGSGVLGNFSTQGAAINKPNHQPPYFLANGLNFNPYIQFNQTATHNSVSSGNAVTGTAIFDATNNTIFQVIKLYTTTNTGVWMKWQWSANPYGGPRFGNELNPGSNPGQIRFDFRNNASGGSFYGTTNVFGKDVISTQEVAATTKTLRVNGNPDGSVGVNGTFYPGTNTSRLTLGAEPYGDDYPTKVDIAEVIIYKRVLSAAERNKVESYLAIKYGITLPQAAPNATNYVASNDAIVWNNATSGLFVNNITGIARDDAGSFDQRQSRSINNRAMVTIYNGGIAGTFPTVNADNTNAFSADLTYLLFGDNQADTVTQHCTSDGSFSKINRTWKVQTLGNPGTVTLALKKANVPASYKCLIVANDPNFTTGLAFYPLLDNGTELYASCVLSNNQYFTFGTEALNLNPVITPVLCQGDNGSVALNPTGGALPITYSWNSTPPQNTATLSNVGPGLYTVVITQANGCTMTKSYSVTGTATPVFLKVIDTVNTICTASNGAIEVLGSGGTPSYQYNVDNGPWTSSKRFENLAAGSHNVKIKDINNCQHDTTVVLTKSTYKLDVSYTSKEAWCDAGGLGGEIVLSVDSGMRPYKYFWPTLPTNSAKDALNIPAGSYDVTVTDYNGCTGNASGIIIDEVPCCMVAMPNAFTPNNDGLNDRFMPVSNAIIPKYSLVVYNRLGQKVFQSIRSDYGWNGSLNNNGDLLEVGTYFYQLIYTCEQSKKEVKLSGDVTLVR
jgi:gliding motility-associated-like protein